jgi:hypothetical protein
MPAIDVTTPTGQVRLLTADMATNTADRLFTDEHLNAFLGLEGNNVFNAAALALETMAVDQVMVLKVIKLLDVQTDGAKVADALLKRAKTLRERAADDQDTADDDFAIAEFADPVFAYRERLSKQLLLEA